MTTKMRRELADVANGKVLIGSGDGSLYCFGVKGK